MRKVNFHQFKFPITTALKSVVEMVITQALRNRHGDLIKDLLARTNEQAFFYERELQQKATPEML